MRAAAAALSLCVLVLAATGCGERSEPTGTAVELYPVTVTDANGSSTTLDAEPTRIVAIGPEMAATLRALGAGARTVTVGSTGRATGDLVAAWSSSQPGAPAEQFVDVPVYVAADQTIEDVERSLADLGLLVGRPLAGRALAEKVERGVARVGEGLQNEQPVSVFLDTGFFTTVAPRSLADRMIAAAGGRNVAASKGSGPLDPAELQQLNPRYYIVSGDSGATLERLRRNRSTRRLAAVRAGRVGRIPERLLQPGAEVGAGVAALARILHPDAFR